jgi:DNA-binding response OmpR family regulator
MKYRILNTLIDTSSHNITQEGKPIKLTHIEFELLLYLLELFEQEKRVKRGWFPKNPKRM